MAFYVTLGHSTLWKRLQMSLLIIYFKYLIIQLPNVLQNVSVLADRSVALAWGQAYKMRLGACRNVRKTLPQPVLTTKFWVDFAKIYNTKTSRSISARARARSFRAHFYHSAHICAKHFYAFTSCSINVRLRHAAIIHNNKSVYNVLVAKVGFISQDDRQQPSRKFKDHLNYIYWINLVQNFSSFGYLR